MTRLFTAVFTITAVVEAIDAFAAMEVARENLNRIVGDSGEHPVRIIGEIKQLTDLPDPWDGMCLPYGGDGSARLMDMLPETATL